jgi:uncharacterized delta-60 repeat protein
VYDPTNGAEYVAYSHVLTRLNANGARDAGFEESMGAVGEAPTFVYAVAVQSDGKILVGGGFTAFKGANRNGIARLNANGSLDNGFNPGAGTDGSVSSVALQRDGKVLIGGSFTSVNGTNRNNIARLDANGSLDSSFDPGTGADGIVRSIVLQPDGKVLIGDEFTTVNGVVRLQVARLCGDSLARPQLDIQRVGSNVVLSWPSNAADFRLQAATNLAGGNNWQNVSATPSTIGSRFYLTTNAASTARMLYRLIAP